MTTTSYAKENKQGKEQKPERNPRFRRIFIRVFWWLLVGTTLCIALLFLLIGFDIFGPLPTFAELENPQSNVGSEILAEDQSLLGTFHIENRSFATREELPVCLVDALICTEDIRYYSHSGIDGRGLTRVLFKTLLMGRKESGGGSTITQQLAKNLFPRDTVRTKSKVVRGMKLVTTKFKEWITAVRLERNYTKDEIITMYFNTVPFGSNAFGIKRAVSTFFGIPLDSLRTEQAALLVGLVKGPTWYSPVRNPERSLARRNVVLEQMRRYHRISRAEYDSLSQLPLTLNYMQEDHNTGLGTYYREHLRQVLTAREPQRGNYLVYEQYLTDSLQWANNPLYGWCAKNVKHDGTHYDIYRDGLKIYTTINADLQRYAEEAVAQHLGETLQPAFNSEKRRNLFSGDVSKEAREHVIRSGIRQSERYRSMRDAGYSDAQINSYFRDSLIKTQLFSWKGTIGDTTLTPLDSMIHSKRQLRVGFMAMEPGSGRVRAYVGGPNFRFFKYDQVYVGRRQVGSTIKPFLYTLAMQEGFSPCLKVPNVPQVFTQGEEIWTPRNANQTKRDGEMVTLKWGLTASVNNISAWLIKQFGPHAVADLMRKMGIKSYIEEVPSIALGTAEVTLYDMVAAYGAFAAGGMRTEPLLVTRIEDKNGNLLASFDPVSQEVISAETAYLMVEMLRGVVDHGSGLRLRYIYQLQGPFGGKTGTTQNHSDGWFISIYPSLVVGTWVGAEDMAVHFSGMAMGQGASMALPIQGLFYKKAFENPHVGITPQDKWTVPDALKGQRFDCNDANEETDAGVGQNGGDDEFF